MEAAVFPLLTLLLFLLVGGTPLYVQLGYQWSDKEPPRFATSTPLLIATILLAIFAWYVFSHAPMLTTEHGWFVERVSAEYFWQWFGEGYGLMAKLFVLFAVVWSASFHYGLRYLIKEDWHLAVLPYVLSFIGAFFFAQFLSQWWHLGVLHEFGSQTGEVDAHFGIDLAFYYFTLPYYTFWLIAFAMAAVGGILAVVVGIGLSDGNLRECFVNRPVTFFVAVLFVIIAKAHGLGVYYLLYGGIFSVVEGAGYVDTTMSMAYLYPILYYVSWGVALVAVAMLVVQPLAEWIRDNAKWVFGGVAAVYAACHLVIPFLFQIGVWSSQFETEQPFIERNIAATRASFMLDQATITTGTVSGDRLPMATITQHRPTIGALRVVDWLVLEQLVLQQHILRPQFTFADVDVARITGADGQILPIMIAPRETYPAGGAGNWQAKHLINTHGYDIVVAAANEFSQGGVPKLLRQGMPGHSDYDALSVTTPQIYYGEATTEYAVVNTCQQEFDYPLAGGANAANVYTDYAGKGGVPLSSSWMRFSFGYRLDGRFFTSDCINDEGTSKVLFRRGIVETVEAIAPFLIHDSDPYLVPVGDGRLMLMLDAYTALSFHPYATASTEDGPLKGYNYARASVKVTVDPYDGTITFYVVDPDDPIIKAYQAWSPDLFTDMDEMPEELRAHVRYPEQLFKAQVATLGAYHVTDPLVFYNQDAQWQVPTELQSGEGDRREPYYIVAPIPGGDEAEFILTQPMVLKSNDDSDVLTGWVAGRADDELVVHRLAAGQSYFGPATIDARITGNPDFAILLNRLNEGDTEVIYGNLVTFVLGDHVLFMKPIYTQRREGTSVPTLFKVVVGQLKPGDVQMVWDDTALAGFRRLAQGSFADIDYGKGDDGRLEEALRLFDLHWMSQGVPRARALCDMGLFLGSQELGDNCTQ